MSYYEGYEPHVIAQADQELRGLEDGVDRLIETWKMVKPEYEAGKLDHLEQILAFANLLTTLGFDASGLFACLTICIERLADAQT